MFSTILKGVLMMTTTAVVIVFGVYIFIASEVFTYLTTIFAAISAALLVPHLIAYPIGILLSLILARPLLRYLWLLSFGHKPARLAKLSVIVLALLAGVGWAYSTRDWLFDTNGNPIAFVCPPLFPGGHLREQRSKVDHEKGGFCEPVDENTATQILALRAVGRIHRLSPDTVEALQEIPRFDSHGPILLAGVAEETGGPPLLYNGRIGIDPLKGNILRPASDDDILQVKLHLLNKEIERSLSQLEQADEATPNESLDLAEKPDHKVNSDTTWKKFFKQDIGDSLPLVVVLGEVNPQRRSFIENRVGGERWWNGDVLREGSFMTEVAEPIIQNPYRNLSRAIFPPSLEVAIFVNPIYQRSDGKWCVTIVKLNIKAWSAEKIDRKFI